MLRNSSQLFKIFSNSHLLASNNCLRRCLSVFTHTMRSSVSTPQGAKRSHAATDRNAQPLVDALRGQIEHSFKMQLLEIASGYGQHVGFFAPRFPNITFQPTEVDPINFASIRAYASDCPNKNIREPLLVDVCLDFSKWEPSPYLQPGTYDYMFNCNMMHIAPWACSIGLFRAAATLLKPNGLLFTYGPYALNGVLEPDSNVQFDRSLRTRNPQWGVRDIKDLKRVAADNGIELKQSLNMPANNKFLTWIKASSSADGGGAAGKSNQNSYKCNI